jgi:hypothetical protein
VAGHCRPLTPLLTGLDSLTASGEGLSPRLEPIAPHWSEREREADPERELQRQQPEGKDRPGPA